MSHPHVIRVSDLIDEGDTVAFVMEYVEGETLKEYLERKGKLTDTEIREIFSQMLDAVGYVHEQKLVHRDIKPSNFMIDKRGKVKLMDFGIAKSLDPKAAEYTQTGTGMQMGTPMYMSPEQITETKSVTAQSDIYSLGVVLWQMVTGKKPYDTKTLSNFQLQLKIVQEPLEVTNSDWDRIIQKATAKNVLHRFKNFVELKQDLWTSPTIKVEEPEITQIDVKRTEEVDQEEINVDQEETEAEVISNVNKKIYLQLFGPTLFLFISTILLPEYSYNIMIGVIFLSIFFLKSAKSAVKNIFFKFYMLYLSTSLFFVIGTHLYNFYTYGYIIPNDSSWLVWNTFYSYEIILFYSLLSTLISGALIIKQKNMIKS